MKHIQTLLCSVAIFFLKPASAQNVYTSYLDQFLNVIDKNDVAVMFKGKGHREDSVFIVNCYNNNTGQLCITASFYDSSLSVLHGKFQSYYADGSIESQGSYFNGDKNGIWQSWDDKDNKTDSANYIANTRLAFAKYIFVPSDKKLTWLSTYQFTDSLKNTFYEQTFSDSGRITSEANFTGNFGLLKTYTKEQVITDTVYTREQAEATFPGGNIGWAKYVQKCLMDFNPADYGAGNGKYITFIRFTIDEEGNIINASPETNFGHHIEKKAMEIIAKGPKWVPAIRFGKRVKAYRRQPLAFIVSGL